MSELKKLKEIANVLRRDVLEMTTEAGSGHPTSCLSCAEIMTALFFSQMSFDTEDAFNPDNDEFILSKGHGAPILYSALFRAGCIEEDLFKLRKLESPLEGHPVPSSIGWIKSATGSLGQGLSIGVGVALAAKMQNRKFITYVLGGDSEFSEGSVYEALQIASYYNLNNLCYLIDVNSLGQRGQTMIGFDLKKYKERLKSFGWNVIVVNGHNLKNLISAIKKSKNSKKPLAIVAKTVKGKGISFLEGKENWHGKALTKEELTNALKEIPESEMHPIKINKPKKISFSFKEKIKSKKSEKYSIGEEVATRLAYGKALAELAYSSERVIALDAEVSNSTFSEEVKKIKNKQFIEMYVAEQNMIDVALGLCIKGFNVFASSFAAFLSRAYDQLRMSAIANARFTVCGSHCGVSIGEDGASQMGLEDIAMFRSIPNSKIFYPSDAVSTDKIVKLCAELEGIKYVRTTRPKTKVIYNNDEEFLLGDFKVLRQDKDDKITLVGAGITLHECLKAHEKLKKLQVKSSIIDLYCIKPLNSNKFIEFVKKHGSKIVVVEDHYQEGGIGEMIANEIKNHSFKIKHLCVKEIPHSGSAIELIEKYKISSEAIVLAAKEILA